MRFSGSFKKRGLVCLTFRPPGHPVQKNWQNPTTLVLLRRVLGTRLTGEGEEARPVRQREGQLQVRVRQGDPLRVQGRLHQRQEVLLRLQDRLQVRVRQGQGHRLQEGVQRIFQHKGSYDTWNGIVPKSNVNKSKSKAVQGVFQ